MKVSIDHDACTGHGRCYALESGLFVDDEEGYGQVVRDGQVRTEDEIRSAREAVTVCPEAAITVSDTEETG